jgi:hypothetical protein
MRRRAVLCRLLRLRGVRPKRQHLRPPPEFIQVIRPGLHQRAPLLQVGRMVLRRADGIAFLVGQLPFDHIVPVTQLMQDR